MKKNVGTLPMNAEYKCIGITDMGEDNYSTCNNCGRPIRYVCELINQENKRYFVGTECVKTLTKANISNEYSMYEQIKAFKKIAEARNLIEKSDNCKFWGLEDKSEIVVVGRSGKQPKKLFIEPIYDPFEDKTYDFVDMFINEVYTKQNVTCRNWCYNDIYTYHDSLKD
jgi:hypothetical protein